MKRLKYMNNQNSLVFSMLSLVIALSFHTAWASSQLEKLHRKSSEFNEMIKESQSNTAELRKTLREQAGIKLDQSVPGTVAREKIEAPKEAEQMVAESNKDFWKQDRKQRRNKLNTNKEQIKRLSEEIKESAF